MPDNPNLVPSSPLLGMAAPEDAGSDVAPDVTAEPPLSPDVANAGAPPPENATLANVIPFSPVDDFNTPTDYEAEAAAYDPLVDLDQREQAAEAAYAEALAGAAKFRADPAAVAPPAVQPQEMPAAGGSSARPISAQPPAGRSLNDFRSTLGTPITFKSPKGEAWKEGDEVGFNDASVEKANPGWKGGSSWTPRASTMGGGYDGSVNAAPSRGTPVAPHKWADSTNRFYERAAERGDNRRVNRAIRRGAY